MFRDPFRQGDNVLVMCETYEPKDDGSMVPLRTHESLEACHGVSGNNTRAHAEAVFNNPKVKEQEVWFGIEQEYTLFNEDKVTPLGWPKGPFSIATRGRSPPPGVGRQRPGPRSAGPCCR
jgi:glutamine synthetase